MKIEIHNLLGARDIAFDLDGIVEVIGPNASGKTSVAVVVQALLTHKANPLGLPAPQAKSLYPHDGDADGYAEIEGATWRPGKGGLTVTTGALPNARPEAVGLIDYTAQVADKARQEMLQSALLPDPDEVAEALRAELAKQLPAADVAGVMEVIATRGLDAVEAIYAERGRVAKREWNTITGLTYGTKVAPDWRPAGWRADMDALTAGAAADATTAAREQLDVLHQVRAVSTAAAEAAAAASAALPALVANEARLDAAAAAAAAELNELPLREEQRRLRGAEESLAALRTKYLSDPALKCPHCAGAVWLTPEGDLLPYDEVAAQEKRVSLANTILDAEATLADRTRDHEALQAKAKAKTEALNAAHTAHGEARTQAGVARRAAEQVGWPVATADHPAALLQAEQEVDDAKRTTEMIQAEARASELAETIARYTDIARAVGPRGVKAKMLGAGLRRLNAGLATLAQEAGWPPAEVTPHGVVAWGGRPVALCSESERWRAQAAIQLTMAALTGSRAVVLDRADVLDPANRAGLVRAVARVAGKTGIAVLLCSTGTPTGDAPWPQIEIAGGEIR